MLNRKFFAESWARIAPSAFAILLDVIEARAPWASMPTRKPLRVLALSLDETRRGQAVLPTARAPPAQAGNRGIVVKDPRITRARDASFRAAGLRQRQQRRRAKVLAENALAAAAESPDP